MSYWLFCDDKLPLITCSETTYNCMKGENFHGSSLKAHSFKIGCLFSVRLVNKSTCLKRTSLTEKMILYFLALGICSIVITGFFSFYTARKALLKRTYDQLTSLRLTRQSLIERFIADRLNETAFLAESSEVGNYIGNRTPGTATQFNHKMEWLKVSGYYSGYILFDEKGEFVVGDLFHDSCNLEGVNINKAIKASANIDPFMVDYHQTSIHTNCLLSVSGNIQHGESKGFLALIIKPGMIDSLMLVVNPNHGLGYSGETYLVGQDYLMRSQSRFIKQSVMTTIVTTQPVMEALENREGIIQASDYRGVDVLSSYGRLSAGGLNWAILAELDYKEATASVYAIRNHILLLTVLTGVAFFILTYIISNQITRPLKRLMKAAIEIGEGKINEPIVVESNDETGELTEAFNSMVISLRHKDDALKLERINRVKSSIDGQDTERQRLSRELHDSIGQSLIGIRLRLAAFEHQLIPDKIKAVIEITDELIDEVRAISNALMPPSLAEFGLMSAIHNLCNTLSETYRIDITSEGEIPAKIFGRKPTLYLFRIIQESLYNAAHHSECKKIKLYLSLADDLMNISIRDDGKGFDPCICEAKGQGLNNIKERVSLLKGKFTIESAPGKGTLVLLEIPVNKSVYDKSFSG